jgi:hypothetical protein
MNLSRLLASGLLLLSLFGATTAFGADDAAEKEAEKHFAAGLAYVDDPAGAKLEEAYREFHAAYVLVPSYKIYSNIGYCALYLERDAEAIDMYRKFLANANAKEMTPRQRKQMETDIQTLSASLVTVTLSTVPDKVTIIDERFPSRGTSKVNRYPGTSGRVELGIHPGTHKITVTAEGYESQSWEIEADPASKHHHEFKLLPLGGAKSAGATGTGTGTDAGGVASSSPSASAVIAPPETSSRRTPTMVYVGAAATGVFAITATVTGLLAQSKKSDLVEFNKDGLHPQEAQSARDSAKLYALFTDIGIGAALLSAGATMYFYLSAPKHAPEGKSATALSTGTPSARTWSVVPSLGPDRANLSVSGSF